MFRKIVIRISELLSVFAICFAIQGCSDLVGGDGDKYDKEAYRFEVSIDVSEKNTLTPTATVKVTGTDGKKLDPNNVTKICVQLRNASSTTNYSDVSTVKIGEKTLQAKKTLSLKKGVQYIVYAYATYTETFYDKEDKKNIVKTKTKYSNEIGGVGVWDYDPGNPFE